VTAEQLAAQIEALVVTAREVAYQTRSSPMRCTRVRGTDKGRSGCALHRNGEGAVPHGRRRIKPLFGLGTTD
jgi:hypothetical protein